jgi:predicted nucleotidyltransferase
MTEKDKRIFDRLKSDFDYATSLGYKVLGVFLQGSQNYGLDYEGSDIDTKAIVVPSFEDFVLNKKPASTTLILPSNEHVDVKDIRLMHECFRKQNINFIEILFTKYRYMNPDYERLYQPMFDNNEKIARYNNYAAVNCMAGMVFEKRKALCHPYEGLKERIEKYGFCNKQLHHIIRCEEFLRRYIAGVSYAKCLTPTNPQSLISIKASYIYTLEQALEIADNCVEIVKQVKQEYMDTHPVVIDYEVDEIMNGVLFNVLKHSFREEINE